MGAEAKAKDAISATKAKDKTAADAKDAQAKAQTGIDAKDAKTKAEVATTEADHIEANSKAEADARRKRKKPTNNSMGRMRTPSVHACTTLLTAERRLATLICKHRNLRLKGAQ